MSKSARFITVEGGEGVGKTTFLAGLTAALTSRGVALVRGREPGGTPSAERIRNFWAQSPAEEPWTPMTELCLVSAARAQHVATKIRPELAAGHWYLCDRYADSSRCYQGKLGGVPAAAVEAIIAASTGGLEPDLTLLLDCDVKIAMRRIAAGRGGRAGSVDRYDELEAAAHERLRRAYLELAKEHTGRFLVLDASRPVEASIDEAMQVIGARFLARD